MKKYEIHRLYVTQASLFGMQEACFYYVHLLWIYVDDTLYIITRKPLKKYYSVPFASVTKVQWRREIDNL